MNMNLPHMEQPVREAFEYLFEWMAGIEKRVDELEKLLGDPEEFSCRNEQEVKSLMKR